MNQKQQIRELKDQLREREPSCEVERFGGEYCFDQC